MKHVIAVALPDADFSRLMELADAEYRRPKDQATALLVEAIRQREDERTSVPELAEAPSR